MTETIGLAVIGGLALSSALLVVRAENLVHAVMWLGLLLLTTGALYALLGASFLAGVQALLYVGGVITLMIFGLMITRRHEGLGVKAERSASARGALVSLSLFALLAVATARTDGLWGAPPADLPLATVADLGRSILGPNLLSFEALSLLLLAAIIGAIVVARRRDPGVASRGFLPAPIGAAPPAGGRTTAAASPDLPREAHP